MFHYIEEIFKNENYKAERLVNGNLVIAAGKDQIQITADNVRRLNAIIEKKIIEFLGEYPTPEILAENSELKVTASYEDEEIILENILSKDVIIIPVFLLLKIFYKFLLKNDKKC